MVKLSFSSIYLPLHSSSGSLIQRFPAELLFITFQDFDIPTLLNICNVCKRFQQIGTELLSKKFKEQTIGLMLTFEQEHKYRFNVPFEFTKFNEPNGNFIFKPKSKQPMRLINSSMVRNPVLSKVSMTGINYSSNKNEDVPPASSTVSNNNNNNNNHNNNNHNLHNNNVTTTTTTTTTTSSSTTPSSTSSKVKKLEENFLQTSLSLNIKSQKDILKKVQYVYRIGHGTTHLRIPYTFTYSVADTPPPSAQKTRGGERWLTPISLECAPSFFYPPEPTAHKIIMTIMDLRRKRNLHKKKRSLSSSSSSSPQPSSQGSNSNSKQKQKQKAVVDFEEEGEDFISIELINDQEGNLNNTTRKRLFEQQMNQYEHLISRKLKGSLAKRWISGARR